jgi:hypothetical protein
MATPPTTEAITITTVMPVDLVVAAAPETESLDDDEEEDGAGTDTV